ncbi:hypothetical protein NPIL_151061 [Nephila pilipes]|uniref:Uncharacterized protein n=1 Tax=Nephila pilipes TaxID=299642 RepID=A0A8X6TGY3_NEPPI|nr:hypothetical protein NPIL_151061 [Nephila pilipes]
MKKERKIITIGKKSFPTLSKKGLALTVHPEQILETRSVERSSSLCVGIACGVGMVRGIGSVSLEQSNVMRKGSIGMRDAEEKRLEIGWNVLIAASSLWRVRTNKLCYFIFHNDVQ